MLREVKTNGVPFRAAVSAFGIGGTNAHAILEEAPCVEVDTQSRPYQLIYLSAKTSSALDTMTANLADHLKLHPAMNLADVAYTLHAGRRDFNYRRALVCRDAADAVPALETIDPKRVFTSFSGPVTKEVVFMFPGQGAQYAGMGRDLYEHEHRFREMVDQCAELLEPHLGLDLRDVLYPSPDRIDEANARLQETRLTQAALFVTEYALAQQFMHWGVKPKALIGHSLGEYVAATIAGVFSLEDALKLVAVRGRLMQELPPGAMLAVPLSEQQVQQYLGPEISLAAINSPSMCVLSGSPDAIAGIEASLPQEGVNVVRLHVSVAFHSYMVQQSLAPFRKVLDEVERRAPRIPYISNVTGQQITAGEAISADYWTRHISQPVRFADGLSELLKQSDLILLEVGPGRTLSTLARQNPAKTASHEVANSIRHPHEQSSDVAFLLNTLGRLWLSGVEPDWTSFYENEERMRVPLPAYPFERQRYWVEAKRWDVAGTTPIANEDDSLETISVRPALPTAYVQATNPIEQNILDIWQEILGISEIGIHDNFFELGGHSLLATQIVSRLRQAFEIQVPLRTIFENPTTASLATAIENILIAELEEVTDEEAERLLEQTHV